MELSTQQAHEIKKWPKVAIIILNWNNYEASSRCLKPLQKLIYPNYAIILVDNDSKDGSKEKLFEQFQSSNILFVFNEKNLGFAAGCNRDIKKALEIGFYYILLSYNDCVIYDSNFLHYGVGLAESIPQCGIVGGKILFWPDTVRIWSIGCYITFWGGERHIGYGEIDKGKYDNITERPFIYGVLILIKSEVLDQIGLLPEAYFFGKEEWEFCTRAIKARFKLLYHPKFSVYHEASNSHVWVDPTYVYNGTLSKILYKKGNLPTLLFRMWFLVYQAYVQYLFSLKYYIQREKYLQGVFPNVLHKAMLKAIKDAPHIERVTEEMLINYRNQHFNESK